MNKQLRFTFTLAILATGQAYCMDLTSTDWGRNGYEIQQAIKSENLHKLFVKNRPDIWKDLSDVEVVNILATPLETSKEEDGKFVVDAQWVSDLLANHKEVVEREYAAKVPAAADTSVTPISKKRFLLTRVVPVAAALGIGYWVGKEGYL